MSSLNRHIFYCKVNYKILYRLNLDILIALKVFYDYTVKNKTYTPAKFSSYTFGKADAQKKLTEEGRFSNFFTVKEKYIFNKDAYVGG
jgi:hypothetical protein